MVLGDRCSEGREFEKLESSARNEIFPVSRRPIKDPRACSKMPSEKLWRDEDPEAEMGEAAMSGAYPARYERRLSCETSRTSQTPKRVVHSRQASFNEPAEDRKQDGSRHRRWLGLRQVFYEGRQYNAHNLESTDGTVRFLVITAYQLVR
jgi:hypothetical protein